MILAAGRGERMRPLTDETPKPLLEIRGLSLIEHQINSIKQAGISEFIINIANMGDQIRDRLGNGNNLGISIHYSDEGNTPLETAGGIIKALNYFSEQFLVANADIYTDFNYQNLPEHIEGLAHLVLVDNPAHHPDGDFSLKHNNVSRTSTPKLTFSGIAIYRPELFINLSPGFRALAPLLFEATEKGVVTGQHFSGYWNDIGTPERLQQANKISI